MIKIDLLTSRRKTTMIILPSWRGDKLLSKEWY